jgi:hypothetical protein
METSYAHAEIWRLRRDGDHVVLEVHSKELDRWIEMRFERSEAWTFGTEMNRLAAQ